MLKIKIYNEVDSFTPSRRKLDLLLAKVFPILFPPVSSLLEIDLVSPQKIAYYNRMYIKHFGPTDIISFPSFNCSSSKIRFLGSLLVSPAYLKKHHQDFNEIIIHGMIHLAGLDHEIDQIGWNKVLRKVNDDLSKVYP